MEVEMKLSIRLFLLTTVFCLIPTAAITMESLPGQVLGIYGGPGDDMGYKIANAQDGGFLLCGTTESFGNSKYDIPDILAIRVDSLGQILWQKDFGGTGSEYPFGLIRTRDGGYIIAGASYSFFDFIAAWVLKIDDNGNVIWQKAIGPHAYAADMTEEMADGSVILSGAWYDEHSYDHPWIAKINPNGDIIWQKAIMTPYGDNCQNILGLDDMGAVIGTFCGIYRFDNDGNMVWGKILRDFSNKEEGFYISDIAKAQTGGFLLANGRQWENDSYFRAELMRISEEGVVMWTKSHDNDNNDTDAGTWLYQILPVGNGKYYACGKGNYNSNIGVTMFSFDESGGTYEDFKIYSSSLFIQINTWFSKFATIAGDGNIVFSADSWVGNWQDKRWQFVLVKTGPENRISGGCADTLEAPISWENISIAAQSVTYDLSDVTPGCIDTAPYNYLNESQASGINTFCPVIYSVKKLQNPFRLEILGDNFTRNLDEDDIFDVTIDGIAVSNTTWKSTYRLIAKKGVALKAMLPKGVPVCIKIKGKTLYDPLGLYESECFTFTR